MAPDFTLVDAQGRNISLSDFKGKKILLSFYRDAGCPFCNLRLYELTRYYKYFAQKGLITLAVFNSSSQTIKRYMGKHERPFLMLADPGKTVFEQYGVQASWGKLMLGFFKIPRIFSAFSKGFGPSLGAFNPLLPADFLVSPDFSLSQVYYSRDASGHIPMTAIEKFLNDRGINDLYLQARTQAAPG